MTLDLAEAVCLYRGRPPPLAADATVVERPHLHLHIRNRELMAFPVVPVNTLTVSGLAVFAIEVGPVTVLVPPGPFVGQGTVSDSDVIVSVFCREGPALVVAQ